MRHTLLELLRVAAAIAIALGITWTAAWAYPLGRDVIHAVGAGILVLVGLINATALRDAWAADRREKDARLG